MSDSRMSESSGLHTWPDAAVPVSGSIRHDRSNKDAQIKVAHSLLSDYHYTCVDTNQTHLDSQTTHSHPTHTQLCSLPRPSFGCLLKETHRTSLSDDVPSFVGVSVKGRETKHTSTYLYMNLWKWCKCTEVQLIQRHISIKFLTLLHWVRL